MKNRISLVLLLCYGTLIHAQDQKFSVTLSYPLTTGDNFVERYDGILDLGVYCRFLDFEIVKSGLSVNGSYLTFTNKNFNPAARINSFFVQPRAFGELHLESLGNFIPLLGLGYSYSTFRYKDDRRSVAAILDESYGGFNINIGCAYDFANHLFAIIQYDFIKQNIDNALDISFNTNVNFIKFGLGYRF